MRVPIWNKIIQVFETKRDANYGPLVRVLNPNDEPQVQYKNIQAVVQDKPRPDSLFDYLSALSGLSLYIRDSEFRYKGNYNIAQSADKTLTIILVPAIQIGNLPRRLRRRGWKFIRVTCPLAESRFDAFPGYVTIPAGKVQIWQSSITCDSMKYGLYRIIKRPNTACTGRCATFRFAAFACSFSFPRFVSWFAWLAPVTLAVGLFLAQ